jgi:GT2 family glycosyltransferase
MEEPQSPRVTALIVSHNQTPALRNCLEALERSTERDRLEVLVLDDGSSDGASDAAADFADVVYMRVPKRIGFTRAVNIGLGTAKGDMVLLLPPEVHVRPETVATLADRLQASPDTGAVCPAVERAWRFPSPDDLSQAWRSGVLPGAFAVGPGETAVDYPKGAAILVRRGLLRAMNWLDKRFGHAWSDLEMCSRIRDGNKSIIVMGDLPVDREAELEGTLSDVEWADSAHGIATWIGIHHGTVAGLKFRLGAALHALGRGKFGVFTSVLSGAKIDGNQP